MFQVIYYLKGNLISYSNNEINIWEQINNKYQSISTLKHTNYIQSILLLEDKKQLISAENFETLIWNLINFELIKILDISCYSEKGLCRIDDDRIIIIDADCLNVFSLSEQKIIKYVALKTHGWEIKVFNEKDIFFVRGWSHDLYIFNCDTYECIQTIKDAHQSNIGVLLKLKENIICTSSRDKIIQIWSF
jgi:WD40 repeat protein